ncbi:MAG: zinc-ribbon domain containing protein [Acidobacteriota bacterium]|nr:zinc-ribbon domain containing protein [Acidobacteriota bacterium]
MVFLNEAEVRQDVFARSAQMAGNSLALPAVARLLALHVSAKSDHATMARDTLILLVPGNQQHLPRVKCSDEFGWSVADQAFLHENGLTSAPKGCKKCRQTQKERRSDIDSMKGNNP